MTPNGTGWYSNDGILGRNSGTRARAQLGGDVASSAFAVYVAAKQGLGPTLLPDWLIAEDLVNKTLIDPFPSFRTKGTEPTRSLAALSEPQPTAMQSARRYRFLKTRVPKRAAP